MLTWSYSGLSKSDDFAVLTSLVPVKLPSLSALCTASAQNWWTQHWLTRSYIKTSIRSLLMTSIMRVAQGLSREATLYKSTSFYNDDVISTCVISLNFESKQGLPIDNTSPSLYGVIPYKSHNDVVTIACQVSLNWGRSAKTWQSPYFAKINSGDINSNMLHLNVLTLTLESAKIRDTDFMLKPNLQKLVWKYLISRLQQNPRLALW